MSSYSLSNSAPLNNIGYNDVPINNQYSNPQRNGPYKQISNYQFNHQVSDTLNSNNDNYEIYQSQSFPSPSLFIEQDSSMSGYGYTSNNGNYNGASIQKKQFNRQTIPHPSEVYAIENFENEDVQLQKNANKLDNIKIQKEIPFKKPLMDSNQQYTQQHAQPHSQHHNSQQQQQQQNQQVVYNNYIPTQPNIYQNDYHYNNNNTQEYINSGSIPNIAGLYNNTHNRPVERVIIKERDNRDTIVTNLDSDSDDDDDDDTNSNDSKETKIKSLKKNLTKKVKKKKKQNNMIYLVIFLLVIVIGLMLYIVMNQKVKRVRF
jgi:hypothetical protein